MSPLIRTPSRSVHSPLPPSLDSLSQSPDISQDGALSPPPPPVPVPSPSFARGKVFISTCNVGGCSDVRSFGPIPAWVPRGYDLYILGFQVGKRRGREGEREGGREGGSVRERVVKVCWLRLHDLMFICRSSFVSLPIQYLIHAILSTRSPSYPPSLPHLPSFRRPSSSILCASPSTTTWAGPRSTKCSAGRLETPPS